MIFLVALLALVSPERIVHGPYTLPARDSLRIAIGGDRDAAMVAWSEAEGGGGRIYAQLLDTTTPIAMPRPADANLALAGSIAKLGDTLTLSWREDGFAGVSPEGRLIMARVRSDGTLLEAMPLAAYRSLTDTTVLATAEGFRLFAETNEGTIQHVVGTSGMALAGPRGVGAAKAYSLIAAGNELAWTFLARGGAIGIPPPPFFVEAHARPLSGEAPARRLWTAGGATSRRILPPAIAWNGKDFLFVWHDGGVVRGVIVGGEPFVIAENVDAPSLEAQPIRVAWDGKRYVVAWETGADAVDVDGAFVSAKGRVEERFDIAPGDGNERGPVLLSLGNGKSIVAYQIVDGTTASLATRTVSGPSPK